MGSRQPHFSARAERRAIVALFALFALLVQALIPSIAMASASSGAAGYICMAGGSHGGHGGAPAPQDRIPGGGCDHCVCPAAAAPPPSTADLGQEAVHYVRTAANRHLGSCTIALGRGLAAPPPPPRGPPSLTA
jgi:hypothetical protein